MPLQRYTPKTLVDVAELEDELGRVRRDGFAIDNEEFLPGLICVAVLIPASDNRSNVCIAAQAPILRLTPNGALRLLPTLQRAAQAISSIETDASIIPVAAATEQDA